MTEKRFTLVDDYLIEYDGSYFDLHKPSDIRSLVTVIGYVTDENEQLKSELAEIKRQEQEVFEYLQVCHNGDINELKKELKE